MDPKIKMRILHLSDLHFGTHEDAGRWYGQLADDLKNELDCDQLDVMIISGDVANYAVEEEYNAAKIFIDRIIREFGLEPADLVIVPGNHDLNWNLSKKGYTLIDREEYEGTLKDGCFIEVSDEVIRLRDDAAYQKRFEYFSDFYRDVKGEPYPVEPAAQGILYHLKELGILILGLNSAWQVDHHFKSRAAICPDAVAGALDQIRENPELKGYMKFAVWHHPLHSPSDDRITDHGFMERLAQSGFSVCFHGHLHKATAELFRYDHSAGGRRIEIVGAGTFGAPVREWSPGFPLQYNLLNITPNQMIVETRCRHEINGAWKPNAIWTQGPGRDPQPRYTIELSGGPQKTFRQKPLRKKPLTEEKPGKDSSLEDDIRDYCQSAEALYENLPLVGFRTALRVPIRIEDIYVPLRAMVDLRATGRACFADAEDAEKALQRSGESDEIFIPDAFHTAEAMGRRGIVILGDPGSGKSTHLKRLLLWCLRGGLGKLGLPAAIIPVFLPLRELRDLGQGLDAFIQSQVDKPHLKTPTGFGRRLLARGNLLFLFDGLDEVADPDQRLRVARWIEDALRVHRSCRFVVTCRFAGYTSGARLCEEFLEMHMRPLSFDQAETFVNNWYRIVETGLSKDPQQAKIIAGERSRDLLDKISRPEFRARRVFELTRNPLLLTNLCLVHRDRGNLPHSRTRLYEECTDVLLELWREAIGYQTRVDARTGRRVLQPVALWLHQKEGRTRARANELAPIVEPALKSVGWSHGSAEAFLQVVRDESGLLTGWDQENYGFMHLGFQEYLAAREIQNQAYRNRNMLKQLATRFGQSWWQEVTLLLLGLENPSLFKDFMREVVRQPAFAKHPELVEMCLDDAAERSVLPFVELLQIDSGRDSDLWERQLAALRVVGRLDDRALNALAQKLKHHPFDKIREWFDRRAARADQNVIYAPQGGYELVKITGGSFMMGSPETEEGYHESESPLHDVQVSDFYLGRFPVTNEEYGRFLKENPDTPEPEFWADRRYNQLRQPVVGVSWEDAVRYTAWAGLRLPSEAEWEYACRANTNTRYYTGDTEKDLDRAGWYRENSGRELHLVGEKEPNAWGLYDMHGNVFEWVEDEWHHNYDGAPNDGRAWVDKPRGANRGFRGGSWFSGAHDCRSADRNGNRPGYRSNYVGFRLSRSVALGP